MRRTLLLTLGTLLGTLLVPLTLLADAGEWGQRGFTRRFVSSGDRLYTADGRGVSVYDISEPSAIRRLDVEWSDEETFDLALMGTTDVVVATRAGVERFGIAAGGTLDRLGVAPSLTSIDHVAASPHYAAASSGKTLTLYERAASGGLTAVRSRTFGHVITALAFGAEALFVAVEREPLFVFDPAAAEPIALLSGANANALAVSNDVLWATSLDDGLKAIDIADPAAPRVLASVGRSEIHPAGLAVAGTRVYAFEFPDRVLLFDASVPAEPRLVATMEEWVNTIGASGTRLFLAGSIVEDSGLAFDPGLIPRETGLPVRIFDTTTLTAPVESGRFADLAGPVSGVWTDGSVAYVVDPPYLRVLDVSITASPREVTRLAIPNLQDRIRVKNGLAVLYGRAYVNLLDVSEPLAPVHIGTWDARGHPPSGAAILESAIIEANEHSGLHIVDVSDPANAVQVGGRKWHYHDVAAGDDAAYALLEADMLVIEVVEQRTVVERENIFIQAEQVDTVPPNASRPEFLLVRGEDGLRLYSLADRFHPAEVDFLALARVELMGTGDRHAYIARDGRLHYVGVGDGGLSLTTTEDRVTSAMQISVAGVKVVVADRYSVRVYGPNTVPPDYPPVRRRSARH